MPSSLAVTLIGLVVFVALPAHGESPVFVLPPLPPNTATVDPVPDVAVPEPRHIHSSNPVRLVIPSIGLSSLVEAVGINDAGEMDVPDGSTKNVGWYRYGTIPGNTGSAVMDAHVFAAFARLKNLKAGSDVYVVNENGEKIHFRVTNTATYPLASVPMRAIFADDSGAYLNFITCAGRFNRSLGTYSHRLVVFAEKVE